MSVPGLLTLFDEIPAYGRLAAALARKEAAAPQFLPTGARAPVAARLDQDQRAPVLLLTGRVDKAVAWQQALETWLGEHGRVQRLPEPTPLPYDRGPWSERTRQGRLAVLTGLAAIQHPLIDAPDTPPIIVTSARAFLQKTLPPRRFVGATRVLRPGGQLDLEKNLAAWQAIGYLPATVVEAAGQFSRRGGILDILPAVLALAGAHRAVRRRDRHRALF